MGKVKSLLLYTFIVCIMLGCTAVFGYRRAVAESKDELSTFSVLYGASIRYGDENGGNGIRFAITMDKTQYTEFMKNHDSVTFGVVIAPYFYYKLYPFNYENLFGDNAKYNWAKNVNGEWIYTAEKGKARIINLSTNALTDYEDGNVIYYASVVDILDENIQLEYACAGYVSYDDGMGMEYAFAKYSDGDATSNVRSMAYVAKCALEELNSVEIEKLTPTQLYHRQLLQTNYLDKAVDENLDRIQGSDEFDTVNGLNLDLPWDKITSVTDGNSYKFDFVWSVISKNGDVIISGTDNLVLPSNSEGEYTLLCTAISKTTENEQTVYVSNLSVIKTETPSVYSDLTTFHRGYGEYSLTELFGDVNGVTEYKFFRRKVGGNDLDFETEASLSLTSATVSGLTTGYYKVVAYKGSDVYKERVLDYDTTDSWVWFDGITDETELYKYVYVYCVNNDISTTILLGSTNNLRKIDVENAIPNNSTTGYILHVYNGAKRGGPNITSGPVKIQIIPLHSKNYYLEYKKTNGENAVLTMDICQGKTNAHFYDMRTSNTKELYTLSSNKAITVKISLAKLIENWDVVTCADNTTEGFSCDMASVYYMKDCANTTHYLGNFILKKE